MIHANSTARWVALVALAFIAACDGGHGRSRGALPGAPAHSLAEGVAEIAGTALDAATGSELADVQVAGPDGARARSDEHGRFLLTGLKVGSTGEVTGVAADGRKASVKLRPLRNERLEVVLHLRRP